MTDPLTLPGQNPVIQGKPGQKVTVLWPSSGKGTTGSSSYRRLSSVTLSGTWTEPVEPPPPPPPPATPYPPVTTLKATPLSPVPPLPARLTRVSDPNGTKVVRIGDNGQRHAYSKTQPWNADGSLLHFAYSGRLLHGSTFALVTTAMGNPGNFQWDPTDPALGYSAQSGDTHLTVWNLAVPTSPAPRSVVGPDGKVIDFGRGINIGRSEGGIADDGTLALIDDAGNVCTFNVKTKVRSPWWSTGGNPNSVTMSRDGKIVVAVFEPGNPGHPDEIWAYNLDGSNAHRVRTTARHGDTAVSTSGRQVWIQADGQMHDLLTGQATQLFPMTQAGRAGHVSGRGEPGWGYYSVYDTTQTGVAGNDQVYAVKLDGSGQVRVYAFANRRGTSYETQPQAVPSRDGSRVLFASDWGNQGTFAFVAGVNP